MISHFGSYHVHIIYILVVTMSILSTFHVYVSRNLQCCVQTPLQLMMVTLLSFTSKHLPILALAFM